MALGIVRQTRMQGLEQRTQHVGGAGAKGGVGRGSQSWLGSECKDRGGSGGRIVYIEDMYDAGVAGIYLALTTHKSDWHLSTISSSTLNTFD